MILRTVADMAQQTKKFNGVRYNRHSTYSSKTEFNKTLRYLRSRFPNYSYRTSTVIQYKETHYVIWSKKVK